MFCVGDSFRFARLLNTCITPHRKDPSMYCVMPCGTSAMVLMVSGWLVDSFLNRDRRSLLRWTLAHCCSSVALNLSCMKADVDSNVRGNVCDGETLNFQCVQCL